MQGINGRFLEEDLVNQLFGQQGRLICQSNLGNSVERRLPKRRG